MTNDKYTLSNNYYVEIAKRGPQSQAILYSPSGSEISRGPQSISSSVLDLVKALINDYTPTGRNVDPSNWITTPTVVKEEIAPKPTRVNIKGRVIDSITNEGLRGVNVTLGKFKTSTQPGGGFNLAVTTKPGEKPPSDNISFTFPKYEPRDTPALKLDGTLKTRVNVIELNTIVKSLKKEESKLLVLEPNTVDTLNSFNKRTAEAAITETINRETNKINKRLIPFALNLLASFGVTSLNQVKRKQCPTIAGIPRLVSKKNKLTRQLNNILRTASRTQTIATILRALIRAFRLARLLITRNPLPSTFGTPPGPAGGVIFSTKLGRISIIEDKKDKLTRLIDMFGNVIDILNPSTIPLVASLTRVLDVLSVVDTLIGECLDESRQAVVDELNKEDEIDTIITNGINIQPGSLTIQDVDFSQVDDFRIRKILGISPEADFNIQDLLSGTFLQVQLDEELTNINKEEKESGTPEVREFNGFKLDIETEDTETNKDLKRRFAVGKDSQGVVVVKGEPSYASSDQILINELIFTIEQKDLKPN